MIARLAPDPKRNLRTVGVVKAADSWAGLLEGLVLILVTWAK